MLDRSAKDRSDGPLIGLPPAVSSLRCVLVTVGIPCPVRTCTPFSTNDAEAGGMRWMKADENLLHSGKVMEAGLDAALVFYEALRANSAGDRKGKLPPHESTVKFIGAVFRSHGWRDNRVEAAIEACHRAKLLGTRPDGGWDIVGWNKKQWGRTLSEAERKRQWRERRKSAAGKGVEAESESGKRPTDVRDSVRDRMGHVPGQDGTCPTKSRAEQSRAEEIDNCTAPGSCPDTTKGGEKRTGPRPTGKMALDDAMREAGVYDRQHEKRRRVAQKLALRGVTEEAVASLVHYATKAEHIGNAGAVLAKWFDDEQPAQVLCDAMRDAGIPFQDKGVA